MASESRRFSSFYLIFIGIIGGFAATSWLAPKILSWYSEPAVPMGVTCAPSVAWALGKIVTAQIVGMSVGGFGLWLLSFLIIRRRTESVRNLEKNS